MKSINSTILILISLLVAGCSEKSQSPGKPANKPQSNPIIQNGSLNKYLFGGWYEENTEGGIVKYCDQTFYPDGRFEGAVIYYFDSSKREVSGKLTFSGTWTTEGDTSVEVLKTVSPPILTTPATNKFKIKILSPNEHTSQGTTEKTATLYKRKKP